MNISIISKVNCKIHARIEWNTSNLSTQQTWKREFDIRRRKKTIYASHCFLTMGILIKKLEMSFHWSARKKEICLSDNMVWLLSTVLSLQVHYILLCQPVIHDAFPTWHMFLSVTHSVNDVLHLSWWHWYDMVDDSKFHTIYHNIHNKNQI